MSNPIWMKNYGSITVIGEKLYDDSNTISVESLRFEDICPECRNEISKFILNNLFVKENRKLEVKYDNEIIKEGDL